MASISSSSHQLHDITSCSICLETLEEPKVLPCIHTFCLQCLESYCESKSQEKEVACPLCRTVFSIPPGGIHDLPDNFFIHQLLNVNKSTVAIEAPESDKPTLCELCSDSEAEVKASFYCVECDQHICDRCSAIHKKAKSSKSHQMVRGNNIPRSTERIKQAGSNCDQHPSDLNVLYCYDCKMIMCLKCVSRHSQHKLSDIGESAEEFRQQLNEDIDKVTAFIEHQQTNLKQIESDKDSFLERIERTRSEISQKYDQLISLMQSHKSQLMGELNQFNDKVVKQIEIKKDEREMQFIITESFKRYCLEMLNKGTVYDISRAAHDLHARAEELAKIQDEPDCQRLSGVEITFKPSFSAMDSVKNFIGELVLKDEAMTTKDNPIRNTEIGFSKFLGKLSLLHVMPTTQQWITGITVLGGEIFVLMFPSQDLTLSMLSTQVNVYKSDDFSWIRSLKITGSRDLYGLVACSHYNCLYVSDHSQGIIYKYDLSNNITTNWSVDGESFRLSLTNCYNVLATVSSTKQIKEFTTQGSLIREIRLDSNIDIPRHCVQLSNGNYVICHEGKQHRICIVDQSGRIIHTGGGSPGSDVGQLSIPCHLAVDKHDNVLVADRRNNRVSLLSPILTYLGDLTKPMDKLYAPNIVYVDELSHRLYIGERDGGRMFVLNADINDSI